MSYFSGIDLTENEQSLLEHAYLEILGDRCEAVMEEVLAQLPFVKEGTVDLEQNDGMICISLDFGQGWFGLLKDQEISYIAVENGVITYELPMGKKYYISPTIIPSLKNQHYRQVWDDRLFHISHHFDMFSTCIEMYNAARNDVRRPVPDLFKEFTAAHREWVQV